LLAEYEAVCAPLTAVSLRYWSFGVRSRIADHLTIHASAMCCGQGARRLDTGRSEVDEAFEVTFVDGDHVLRRCPRGHRFLPTPSVRGSNVLLDFGLFQGLKLRPEWQVAMRTASIVRNGSS
jgi:hypothetical protein